MAEGKPHLSIVICGEARAPGGGRGELGAASSRFVCGHRCSSSSCFLSGPAAAAAVVHWLTTCSHQTHTGHVDSGKSTTTGRLLFELGGIPERELEKLKEEAAALGKQSFAFAFYMDRQKEERERGVTISCTTKEFFTDRWHYTIIDAPGHRDFIKNMISGAAQADVCLLMVPADGNFTTAIQKGDHKAAEIQGQTRQHARLINLLGVKQLICGVNKMDSDVAGYK
jgi:translation elongation factor EF-1alpha